MKKVTPPPTLNGKGFRLSPLNRDNLSLLHKWESDPSSLYLYTLRKDVLSREEYIEVMESRLEGYYHVFLLIINHEDKPIGFIYSYDANAVDGFAFVTTFLEPESRRLGLGAKAGLLFYDYLFAYYPLRKIYCDVFEYNDESLSALKHAGFEIEGKFREHRFFQGKHHMMYRLAIYRERFYKKFGSMVQRVVSNDIP